jgi:hypothetical protein
LIFLFHCLPIYSQGKNYSFTLSLKPGSSRIFPFGENASRQIYRPKAAFDILFGYKRTLAHNLNVGIAFGAGWSAWEITGDHNNFHAIEKHKQLFAEFPFVLEYVTRTQKALGFYLSSGLKLSLLLVDDYSVSLFPPSGINEYPGITTSKDIQVGGLVSIGFSFPFLRRFEINAGPEFSLNFTDNYKDYEYMGRLFSSDLRVTFSRLPKN